MLHRSSQKITQILRHAGRQRFRGGKSLTTTSSNSPGSESTAPCYIQPNPTTCFATDYINKLSTKFSENQAWQEMCNTVHNAPPTSVLETIALEEEEGQRQSARAPFPPNATP
ncbi:hypothetical protein TrVE_jg10279 [Triparma verrucosa]|uniref:Uncharacterized protein n=1 Tax=Triparma verrucosa TaxID=1606542 RepID=A0A9W7C3D2_9STRA|nr:hypothetical protein TrVE_jg10279 [Triparma verrucosa]